MVTRHIVSSFHNVCNVKSFCSARETNIDCASSEFPKININFKKF